MPQGFNMINENTPLCVHILYNINHFTSPTPKTNNDIYLYSNTIYRRIDIFRFKYLYIIYKTVLVYN